jgi:hypothetical protein
MDNGHYGLDGRPIYSNGVDCDPVTGLKLPLSEDARSLGDFAWEPYSLAFIALSIGFIVFLISQA